MTTYESSQVLTVKELSPGDILHCGWITEGICMTWHVVRIQNSRVIMRVGSANSCSIVVLGGHDIRELAMFRAACCPNCHDASELPLQSAAPQTSMRLVQMPASNLPSSFRFPEARRRGVGNRNGGAFTRKDTSNGRG